MSIQANGAQAQNASGAQGASAAAQVQNANAAQAPMASAAVDSTQVSDQVANAPVQVEHACGGEGNSEQAGNNMQAVAANDATQPAAIGGRPTAGDNAQSAAGEAAAGEQPAADDAAAADADEPLAFEQQVERVRKTVNINPRFREIHIHTLGFCQQQRTLTEVEEMIGALPEFPSCDQNQYRLIIFLEDAGGLERLELDEAGNIVTPADKEGLTENEIDDLVWQYAFKTTEAGRAVYDEMQPQKRMSKLGSMFPKRVEAYAQVLDFCTQPRTFKEIDNLLAGSDVLKSGSLNKMTDVALQPSVFIDQLERAGGLVWDGSWNITEAGRGFLEAMTKANA